MILLNGEEQRCAGTYYDHTMYIEPDPRYFDDYDAFYLAISAPGRLPHDYYAAWSKFYNL